ncbi:MAG: phage major capsid protein, P2 family [Phenylobacterium sp.]|nr:phage major capsid protein, P2 family [Phenylobacterium sp.]
MRNETRLVFNHYLDRQAQLNQAPAAVVRGEKAFSIEPSIQQKLNEKQQEDSAFLKAINLITVDEMKGEKLGMGIGGPLASRTNTDAADRATRDPTTLDQQGYEVVQTNSDTHVSYAKLDQWAKFPDFQNRMRSVITKRQALDRIMIGWNGTSAAATTNIVANPLLQDVNKGWLAHARAYDGGSHVFADGPVGVGKIIVKASGGGDYRNLDALVVDLVHNLLPSWAREDPNLVAIIGAGLLHDKYYPLVNANLAPTETLAADLVISQKRIGNKKAVTVPYFPADAIAITRLDNLSIYEQAGKRRRTIVDNAKRNRIETYESSNDGYVIEDFDFFCAAEKVEIQE